LAGCEGRNSQLAADCCVRGGTHQGHVDQEVAAAKTSVLPKRAVRGGVSSPDRGQAATAIITMANVASCSGATSRLRSCHPV
jgi:hypothetical protein